MERTILHCDCNSFFASVETALNPAYRDVPMAVCGREEQRHGIVLAKNELAKAYGIQTAETVKSAKQKCPKLVIAEPHYPAYVRYSRMVGEIYKRYTDTIEPFGIDESWLDVTASRKLFGTGEQIAERIRREVREEIGITVSVGVSFNKIFAKLGSDYKKPDAVTVITRESVPTIVYPLPVGLLLFVGRRTEAELRRLGIQTIGDLAAADEGQLSRHLGRIGEVLISYARGEDRSPVEAPHEQAKSISNGFTFSRDLVKEDECRRAIDVLTEEIGMRLRRSRLVASTVALRVKDTFLKTHQKQQKLPKPTALSREIADSAFDLYRRLWTSGAPIRSITVAVSQLTDHTGLREQMSFFTDEKEELARERTGKREEAVDRIRERFGTTSILRASVIGNDFGLFDPSDREGDE